MKKELTIAVIFIIILSSCGSGTAPKVIPGAGSTQVYEMMEEDSTDVQKPDTVVIQHK